jgi:hypothetical protein
MVLLRPDRFDEHRRFEALHFKGRVGWGWCCFGPISSTSHDALEALPFKGSVGWVWCCFGSDQY